MSLRNILNLSSESVLAMSNWNDLSYLALGLKDIIHLWI